MFLDINFLAVLLAGVVNMIVGSFWYSPAGFGKMWMKLAKVEMGSGKNMGMLYGVTFVSALVQATVLSLFIKYAGSVSALDGALIGLLVGIGFIGTSYLNQVTFGGKPLKLYYLDMGYYLVVLTLNGALIASLM